MKARTSVKANGIFTGKADHDTLAFLDENAYSGGTSSYDRDGGNNDGFFGYNFIRREESGDYVMCDLKGEGVITRIWLTGSFDKAKNTLKFYIDGETPVYSLPFTVLNDEKADDSSAFPYPLVKRWYQSACGTVLITPLRFRKSCKITVTGVTGKTDGSTVLFYHVDYKLFGEKVAYKPFAGRFSDSRLRATVKDILPENLGKDPKSVKGVHKQRVRAKLKADETVKVFEREGKGQIQGILLSLKDFTVAPKGDYSSDHLRDRLNGLKILIYWDGESTPAVSAPIGSFFGIGTLGYKSEIRSLYFGVKGNTLYNYFPMPFEKNARICFVSDHEEEIVIEIAYKSVDYDFSDVGYFHTEFREFSVPAADPFEAVFFDKCGRGKVVAIQENIFGEEGADCRFEEGDNRIYIDGSRFPDIIGTGTEDYYNGAGYFLDNEGNAKLGLYTSDFTGYTAYRREGEGTDCREAISAYRILINDGYEFRRHIRICFEHGGGERSMTGEKTMDTNQTAGYQVLVSYYYRPQAAQTVSDYFEVAGESAKTHAYSIYGEKESVKKESAFFGGEDLALIHYTAVFLKGKSSFTMSLPSDNCGAVLRRVCDCSKAGQCAKVYVDGRYVGEWYTAQANEKFTLCDPYFPIPSTFTAGKEKIRVCIENVSSVPWSEVSYQLCPICKSGKEDTLPDGEYVICSERRWLGVDGDRIILVNDENSAHPFRIFSCGNRKRIISGITGELVCISDNRIRPKKFNGVLSENSAWTIVRNKDGWTICSESGKYFAVKNGRVEPGEEKIYNFKPFEKRLDCNY